MKFLPRWLSERRRREIFIVPRRIHQQSPARGLSPRAGVVLKGSQLAINISLLTEREHLNLVTQQPIPQFRLEPGRFRRHDLAGVTHLQQIIDGGREH